ncbi:MAG TPA: LuxR C-terminal-related transcriptional regulator, partial [Pilimelia sp.]|nr:LuxR C-terminal-related transcriptional regulator [Pilimelia sp.]
SRAAMGNVIELRALRALALAAGGEHTAAVAALAEALTLAHPQGHLRVIADEGAPMTVLLGQLIATQPAAQTPAAMPGVVEPLTAREMQVLTLLAVGRSNGRIAAELYVTNHPPTCRRRCWCQRWTTRSPRGRPAATPGGRLE